MSTISAPDLLILRGNRSDGSRKILTPRGLFVSIETMSEVFAGQLNGSPLTDSQTFGIYQATVDNTSGSAGNTLPHMTVNFGSSAGASDIGQARLRKAATSTILYLSEMSPSQLPIADNHYFSVKRSWRPWLVLPRGVGSAVGTTYTNTITMYTDYDIAYSDQNANIAPKANITRSATVSFAPKPAGFVDGFRTTSPQTYRTLVLSGALSLYPGSSNSAYLWAVGDGTITVGTTASATITVRFPVGFRWISLTVTAANGKSSVMYFPIWVHDANNMPLSRVHPSRNFTGDWREMELEFFQQNTAETIVPKGCAICVWEYDPFWGETIPDQYRDQFLGWNKEDTTLFRKYDSRNTLLVTGLTEWLSRYRAIPMRVYDPGATPTSWFEMQNITNDKLAFYLLQHFSTAHLLGNLWLSGITDRLKSLDLTGNSLFGQAQYAVLGYQGIARCDSLNSIWLRKHYPYLTIAERALRDKTLSLTQVDRPNDQPLKLARRKYFAVASVLGAGGTFNGSTQTIYNSRAPGRTPYDSNSEQDAPGINLPTTDPQGVLNWLTGQHLGILNNANPSVPYETLPNLDCVEPAWDEAIQISDVNPDSGYTISNKEFLVKETNITYESPYEGRGKRTEYTLEEVTTNVEGQFVEVVEDTTDPPDYEPPQDITVFPIFTGPDSNTGLFSGVARLAVFTKNSTNDSLRVTLNGANFNNTILQTLGLSGRYVRAVVDPWSPSYISGSGGVNGWVMSTTEVRRITDVGGSPALGTAFSFGSDVNDVMYGGTMHTHIAARNFVLLHFGIKNAVTPSRNGHYVYRTTDGTSWSGGKINDNDVSGEMSIGAGFRYTTSMLWVSAHNAGHAWIADTPAALTSVIIRKSTDYGANWTTLHTQSSVFAPTGIHIPYHNNSDDGIFYFSVRPNGGSDQLRLFRYDHGTSSQIVTPTSAGFDTSFYDHGIDTYVQDRNIIRGAFARTTDDVSNGYVESDDAGANWTYTQTPAGSNTAKGYAIAGDNRNVIWRIGPVCQLEQSVDDGANWNDISGDLPNAGTATIDALWGL